MWCTDTPKRKEAITRRRMSISLIYVLHRLNRTFLPEAPNPMATRKIPEKMLKQLDLKRAKITRKSLPFVEKD